jgi:hypothetical protein
VRHWISLILGGVLVGAGSTSALAQNLCSPSSPASTVRYAGYPGSSPYSNNTTNITSNCSGPNVNVQITPDPYATDLLPAAAYASPTSSGSSTPTADPASLYAPGPDSGYAAAPYAAAPPPMSAGYGVPFSYGGGYTGAGTFGQIPPPNYAGAFGTPAGAPGGYPGYPGFAGYPGYPGMGGPYGAGPGYPGFGYPGAGYPRVAPFGYGSLVPGGYPSPVPGGY